ncbi:MFS transporter [Streptomyces sp. NPDC001100]
MVYLLDGLGVENTGVIGLATAVASAATVAGAITFARLKRSPDLMMPTVFAICAAGFGVMFLAGSVPLLVVGAVINCLGTGMLLPALLTSAMSRLEYKDRGRGTGLWMAAYFGGCFVCPLVLFAVESAVGTPAGAVGLLGLATAAVALGLLVAADDEDPAVRALAARDSKVPQAAVERLTRDPDPAVRAAFARHPNLPSSRLADLLDDEELVHHAAANPALPAPAIRGVVSTCAGSADGE